MFGYINKFAHLLYWKRMQFFRQGGKVAWKDIRINHLGQIFPIKPTILNLLVNDICNSRCQMCLVWKQKKDAECSPDEFARILQDTLFINLAYIGVSGGEPTLREDLPEIFRMICATPSIRGTGIITNAIRKEIVIARIEQSAKICRKAGVPFHIMVSLDGIGEIHDRVRGHKGNFDSAVEVLRYFKTHTEIPVSIGCTFTKENVWQADDVLDFCQKEGINAKFRVAEFIDRLHNHEQTEYIQNFSEQERYHLGLFFAKLERLEKKNSSKKRGYRNIRKMLLEKSTRQIKCHWQNIAVTLDCRGQLFYCAPHSPVLGNCLRQPAWKLYKKNLHYRQSIINTYCDKCIHDYDSTATFREWLEDEETAFWRQQYSNPAILRRLSKREGDAISQPHRQQPKTVMIIGWYGTETAGDKAILAELIFRIREKSPMVDIILASLYPYYSHWTIEEFSFENIRIISSYSFEFWKELNAVGELIMGGGPLMHINPLYFVAAAFHQAKRLGKKTWVAGCGIGPLDKDRSFEAATQIILANADTIELRDADSVAWAKAKTGRIDIINSGDYATGFVQRWMTHQTAFEREPFLNLYLREWTTEYQGEWTKEEFQQIKRRFEERLAECIRNISVQLCLTIRLLPMHHFFIGGDDRDFNRLFARTHLSACDPIIEKRPISVHEILTTMQQATLSICMRFHSVLFANTLKVPFIAIDYTHGGKIERYLKDNNKLECLYTAKEIADGRQITVPLILNR